MLRNGFRPYLAAIANPKTGNPWARPDWNWNQVVNGGMLTVRKFREWPTFSGPACHMSAAA